MDNRARAAMIRKVEHKIKAKYRKRCLWIFLITLIVGLVLGIVLCKLYFPSGSDARVMPAATTNALATSDPSLAMPASTPVATVAATPLATPEPTAAEAFEPPQDEPEATGEADALAAYFGLSTGDFAPETEAPTEAPTEKPTEAPTQAPVVTEAPEMALLTATPDPGAQSTDMQQTGMSAAGTTDAAQTVASATSDPNAKGTMANPVLIKESYTFDTQILADGFPRIDVANTNYETVRISMIMKNYLMPDYFAEKYANKYKLTGSEAGTEISLKVESSTGSVAVVPQNAIQITFETDTGVVERGYQLMDAEIAGRYDVAVGLGETALLYKRFAYNAAETMKYMVVTYYIDGQAHKVYFKLEVAEPEYTYETLTKGSRGDAVKSLQERLVALGYLNDTADGIFGSNTGTAVRAAQAQAGMAETGVADNEFQQYIFSASAAHSAT